MSYSGQEIIDAQSAKLSQVMAERDELKFRIAEAATLTEDLEIGRALRGVAGPGVHVENWKARRVKALMTVGRDLRMGVK